jgi:GNAT superfamily N-acetyltransferase
VILRSARDEEAIALSALALRAKAHWGYDADFLDACRDELTVHSDDIATHRLTVAVDEKTDRIIGFYGLFGTTSDDAELTALFVAPDAMGTGTGRRLFEDALCVARIQGLPRFRIESDHFAASFYEHMGATNVGTVMSHSIPGREIPLYVMDVAPG